MHVEGGLTGRQGVALKQGVPKDTPIHIMTDGFLLSAY
jgi:hypothetical protein